MNYKKLYENLIEKAKLRKITPGYTEKHHIIPRALNGTNDEENIVVLTGREHFIAHKILAKIYPNSGMIHAAYKMACIFRDNEKVKITSREYEYLRQKHAERVSNDTEANLKKSLSAKGKKQTPEHIAARVKARKENGKAWLSEDAKKNMRKKKSKQSKRKNTKFTEKQMEAHLKGVETRKKNGSYKHTEEQNKKLSENRKGKPGTKKTEKEKELARDRMNEIKKCPYCGHEDKMTNLIRTHYKKCKMYKENVNE